MIKEKLIILLNQSVEKWNDWRSVNQNQKIDLSKSEFNRIRLVRGDFSNMTIKYAIFKGTILNLANFSKSNLVGIKFESAFLMEANFNRTNLNGGRVLNSNLIQANFNKATLNGTNFSNSRLSKANFKDAWAPRTKWRGANLEGVSFVNADLSSADFSGANLTNVDFTGADLSLTNFSNANLSNSILTDVYLEGVNLVGVNLTGAKISNVDFSKVDLTRTNFTSVFFENTNFFLAKLSGTIFGLTNLSDCLNLETTILASKCIIDLDTLKNSPNIPFTFLHKLGISEFAIDYAHDLTITSAIKMFPVYLSHSWQDKQFAKILYESLIERNIHCWFDEKKGKTGTKIVEAINTGIENYDKMILICSKDSLTSWWVELEIERILEKERNYNRGKKEKDKVNLIIPITIDDYIFDEFDSPWSTHIKKYIIGDFREWTNDMQYKKSLRELLNSVQIEPIIFIPPSHLSKKD